MGLFHIFDLKIKTKLLDEDELKAIEDTLTKVCMRVVRQVAREGFFGDAAKLLALAQRFSSPAAPPPTAPVPDSPVTPAPAPAPDGPKKYKSLKSELKIVPLTERPAGYVARDDAVELIGGGAAAKSAIATWIWAKQIPAIIVNGMHPPTKGLPGRLMVDKAAVLARNEQRKQNARFLPMLNRHRSNEPLAK